MDKTKDKILEQLKKQKSFINKIKQDRINIYATQAAFFFIVSAVPFMMFLLSLMKYVMPLSESEFISLITESVPNSLQYWFYKILSDVYTDSTISLTSVAVLTTLWAASKSTYALSLSLVEIYETKNFATSLKIRLHSILNTFFLIIVVLASLVFVVFAQPIRDHLVSLLPRGLNWLYDFLNISDLITYFFICLGFTALYRVLSHSKMKYLDHLPGGIVASSGWIVFSYIYSIYINNFSKISTTYGSLASVVVMMLWLKFCMTIFLFGGELNMYLKIYRHISESDI